MSQLCSWCGLPCDCPKFPWTENGFIPQKCADLIIDKIPYLYSLRKMSKENIQHAKNQIANIEAENAKEKRKKSL